MNKSRSTLRCLAIRQPYAWAVAVGAKDVENRVWSTDYRGTIVIQASTSRTEVNATAKRLARKPGDAGERFAYAALIGVADLVDCVPLAPDLEANPWVYGPYCFRLANARIFEKPIPAKGKLNLYHLDEKLDAHVREQLPGARAATLTDDDRTWLDAMHAEPTEQRDAFMSAYHGLGRYDDIERLANVMLGSDPNDAYALGMRGMARGALASRSLDDALADLNRALELEPEDARWWLYRGAVLGDLGRAEEAARDEARARELDPTLFDEAPPEERQSEDAVE